MFLRTDIKMILLMILLMIGTIVSVKDEEIDVGSLRVMLPFSAQQHSVYNDIFHRHQRSLRYSKNSGLADRGKKKVIFQV